MKGESKGLITRKNFGCVEKNSNNSENKNSSGKVQIMPKKCIQVGNTKKNPEKFKQFQSNSNSENSNNSKNSIFFGTLIQYILAPRVNRSILAEPVVLIFF